MAMMASDLGGMMQNSPEVCELLHDEHLPR
jgi:hypothetical protein